MTVTTECYAMHRKIEASHKYYATTTHNTIHNQFI